MRDKVLIESKKSEILKLTGEFCDSHIDAEYRELCEKVVNKMARKRDVPFLRGRIDIWAAAVIYALGQINFLFDSSFEPYVPAGDICAHFGSSMSTVSQKAKRIRDMFGMAYFDDEFSTRRSDESNPLRDLVMLENGLIVPVGMLEEMYKKAMGIKEKFAPFQEPAGGEGRKRKRRGKPEEEKEDTRKSRTKTRSEQENAAESNEGKGKQKSLFDF